MQRKEIHCVLFYVIAPERIVKENSTRAVFLLRQHFENAILNITTDDRRIPKRGEAYV